MPKLGDTATGKELGKNHNGIYKYSACEGCGKERWVEVHAPFYVVTTDNCKKCAPKWCRL